MFSPAVKALRSGWCVLHQLALAVSASPTLVRVPRFKSFPSTSSLPAPLSRSLPHSSHSFLCTCSLTLLVHLLPFSLLLLPTHFHALWLHLLLLITETSTNVNIMHIFTLIAALIPLLLRVADGECLSLFDISRLMAAQAVGHSLRNLTSLVEMNPCLFSCWKSFSALEIWVLLEWRGWCYHGNDGASRQCGCT